MVSYVVSGGFLSVLFDNAVTELEDAIIMLVAVEVGMMSFWGN